MRVHINEVVEALRREGHVVRVVGPGAAAGSGAGASSALERAADWLRKMLPPAAFEMLELAYNIPAYLRLSAAARAFRPDVLYERYNLFLLAGLLLRRRRGLPMLLEINSPLAAERSEFGRLQLKAIARRCEAALWRGADVVLPVTHVLAAQVREIRKEGGWIQVAPNGADPCRWPDPDTAAVARQRLGLDAGAVVLGFVGFVRAWHGLDWGVEALADLPDNVHLVVVGDGPACAPLQARAEALGVHGRVHLLGRVPHDQVGAHMRGFDIALQTASTPYASPLKLFEYMALGRAIIAPDQANIREVLTHGQNALLFKAGREEAFRMALRRLCLDAGLRERLGQNARRTLDETPYTWANNATRIVSLGQAALRLRNRRGDEVARAFSRAETG
jgi:glycosyltransferase involved in cell wall biosynthesis